MLMMGAMGSLVETESRQTKHPSNWGERRSVTWGDLKKEFVSPDMIYAPCIFWFWDEPLKPKKMAEMSRVLASQGFNSGYAHGRNSIVGMPGLPANEGLGDAWFSN